VELLVVILILAVLIALLLPAINGAVRSARTTAVSAEINQLSQALASFKAKYGDYPPSRILLREDGNYTGLTGVTTLVRPGDITVGQLAQRSLAALRKYFPKVNLSTSGPVFPSGSAIWYDFNGNNVADPPYVLQGHECLVFFLGGIPLRDASGSFSMTGFAKDPVNPFKNSIPTLPNGNVNPMYSNNRQVPLFEFNASRLALDPNQEAYYVDNDVAWNSPGYLDSLGNAPSSGQINFLAYFSAYGNGSYDPNDVDFPSGARYPYPAPSTYPLPELDANLNVVGLSFRVNFPPNAVNSRAPNPYTTTLTVPANNGVVTFHNPQTFQIISAGIDGLYGLGGQYLPEGAAPVPFDDTAVLPKTNIDESIRNRERDNITNFHNGRLD